MEQETIYYTCKEYYDEINGEYKFVLRKCSINDGKLDFYISGFHGNIRGIARDSSDGSYYVVDSSSDNRVLKFDKDWNPLRKSHREGSRLLYEPSGIVVDKGNIFVFSKDKICILDTTLKIFHVLKLPLRSIKCIGITKFEEKYFITTENAIIVISINELNFEGQLFEHVIMPDGKIEKLTNLRAICSSEKYLYATKIGNGGCLLCLEYCRDNLKCVHTENKCTQFCSTKHQNPADCSPVALAYHDGKVYYSQGCTEGKYYVVQLTHGETIESKKLFEV